MTFVFILSRSRIVARDAIANASRATIHVASRIAIASRGRASTRSRAREGRARDRPTLTQIIMNHSLDDDDGDDSDCVRDAENTPRAVLASATRPRSAVSVAFGTFFAGREPARRGATRGETLRAALGEDDARWRPKMFSRALNVRVVMLVVMVWAEMALPTYDTSRDYARDGDVATRRVDAEEGGDAARTKIESSVGAFACESQGVDKLGFGALCRRVAGRVRVRTSTRVLSVPVDDLRAETNRESGVASGQRARSRG